MATTLDGLGLQKLAITDTFTTLVEVQNANMTILDAIYPVGSIYLSTASTDPSTFLGGTWTRIEGKFLVGAGSKFAAGTTGGTEDMGIHLCSTEVTGYGLTTSAQFQDRVLVNEDGYTGKMLPPYLSVYMWERTA